MVDLQAVKSNKTILSKVWIGIIITIIGFVIVINIMSSQMNKHTYSSPYISQKEDSTPLSRAIPSTPSEESVSAMISNHEITTLTNEASLSSGKVVYDKNCLACHGPSGGGTVGPNLTDEYRVHGGSIQDIVKIINEGNLAKGMIAWESTLSAEEILQVASFILSLQGSNPVNGKAPEGEKF